MFLSILRLTLPLETTGEAAKLRRAIVTEAAVWSRTSGASRTRFTAHAVKFQLNTPRVRSLGFSHPPSAGGGPGPSGTFDADALWTRRQDGTHRFAEVDSDEVGDGVPPYQGLPQVEVAILVHAGHPLPVDPLTVAS